MKEKIIKVEADAILIDIIVNSLKDLSKKKIKSFIKYKMVEVDNIVEVNSNKTVKRGSVVKITFSKRIMPEYDIDIIYEDNDLICINKPSGLLSISNNKEKEITAFRLVSDYVKTDKKNAKIFVVHRLDQATSGVLLFAKNEKIKEKLQKDWNNLVKKREYIAVVEGKTITEDTIESYLTMNHIQVVHSTKNKDIGLYAKTYFKRLKMNSKYSLLDVEIFTGRRNQIRVHMSENGHPVVGDKKYGAKSNPIGRLALHAKELIIKDPRNGKMLKLTSNVPEEILNIVK